MTSKSVEVTPKASLHIDFSENKRLHDFIRLTNNLHLHLHLHLLALVDVHVRGEEIATESYVPSL